MSRRSISVVVPTVGRRDLLEQTLRSVLGQTRPPDEVVVVLDGDRDGTGAMLAARFPDVVRVPTRSHSAAFSSRRAGIAAARGEWVAFVDDDEREMARGAFRAGRPPEVPAVLRDDWAELSDPVGRAAVLVPHPLAVSWAARGHG